MPACAVYTFPGQPAQWTALQLAEIPLRARNSGNASLARALRITSVV